MKHPHQKCILNFNLNLRIVVIVHCYSWLILQRNCTKNKLCLFDLSQQKIFFISCSSKKNMSLLSFSALLASSYRGFLFFSFSYVQGCHLTFKKEEISQIWTFFETVCNTSKVWSLVYWRVAKVTKPLFGGKFAVKVVSCLLLML